MSHKNRHFSKVVRRSAIEHYEARGHLQAILRNALENWSKMSQEELIEVRKAALMLGWNEAHSFFKDVGHGASYSATPQKFQRLLKPHKAGTYVVFDRKAIERKMAAILRSQTVTTSSEPVHKPGPARPNRGGKHA